MRVLALLLLLPTLTLAAPWSRKTEPVLLTVDQAFQLEPVTWRDGVLTASFRVTPGHYLYQDKLEVLTDIPLPLTSPQGERYEDPHFGNVVIYRHDVVVTAPVSAPPAEVTVQWQGCADIGICYPPQRETVAVDVLP